MKAKKARRLREWRQSYAIQRRFDTLRERSPPGIVPRGHYIIDHYCCTSPCGRFVYCKWQGFPQCTWEKKTDMPYTGLTEYETEGEISYRNFKIYLKVRDLILRKKIRRCQLEGPNTSEDFDSSDVSLDDLSLP